MSFRSNIRNFINKYSANSFLERLDRLILYVKKSIENTGNSFHKFSLILLLLVLIGIKRVGLFIKNISDEIVRIIQSIWNFIVSIWDNFIEFLKYVYDNFLELLDLVWQFIRKVFFLTVVEEVGFYFKKLKDFSKELKENLTIIVQKLQGYSDFLSKKFDDKHLTYSSIIPETYLSLSGNALFWFLVATVWGILTIILSTVLILGTIIGIPVLHQFIRKELIDDNEE